MSKISLPAINALRLPEALDYDLPDEILAEWDVGLRASASGGPSLDLFGVIGGDFYGDGPTDKSVAKALGEIGGRDVTVNINSPGGSYFHGVAIYEMLRAHSGSVFVNVLGLAASAASLVAMAGDTRKIATGGMVLIHDAWVVAIGNKKVMAEAGATLSDLDAAMAQVYSGRSGNDVKTVADWMSAETSFTGQKAIDSGFADGLLSGDTIRRDTSASVADQRRMTVRRTEAMLVRQGMTRSEARMQIKNLRGDMPGAVTTEHGKPGATDLAAVNDAVERLLATIRS